MDICCICLNEFTAVEFETMTQPNPLLKGPCPKAVLLCPHCRRSPLAVM